MAKVGATTVGAEIRVGLWPELREVFPGKDEWGGLPINEDAVVYAPLDADYCGPIPVVDGRKVWLIEGDAEGSLDDPRYTVFRSPGLATSYATRYAAHAALGMLTDADEDDAYDLGMALGSVTEDGYRWTDYPLAG